MKTISVGFLACAMVLVLSGCSGGPAPLAAPAATTVPTAAPTAGTFTDPFAYCAAVGNVDKPDARYAGPQVPETVINGFKKAAGLESSTEPLDTLQKTTIWRCMDSTVYACNFGANLPCDSKANADKTPTQAMGDYCKANPNSDFIPMSVTGHDTIYSWHCTQDSAAVLNQVQTVDGAGYIKEIWYPVQP